MSVFLYNIFLLFYNTGIRIAAWFNPKAKKWVAGRKNILARLEAAIPADEKTIWMHCASLGEFEQGRPLLESIRSQYPSYKILLTFFSPSGYEVQKNYKGVDWVFYLPMDSAVTARRFLEIVHPSLAIFIKYEFWYYYLKKIKYREIPLILVSAIFRKDMAFFKWHGALLRKMLSRFDHLFVQNEKSKALLDSIGLDPITTVSGDTRFDRVVAIAQNAGPITEIEKFVQNHSILIAGSTWPEDEIALQAAMEIINDPNLKLVIAPHEIHEKHIDSIKTVFPTAMLFSSLKKGEGDQHSNVLIIDNIGMLSRLYQYATITYIGGGLNTLGLHNTLEAAVWAKPVLFGPHYKKYSEATGLINCGGALSFTDEKRDGIQLAELITGLLTRGEDCERRGAAAGEFVRKHTGASKKIIDFIQEKRLLTN